MGLGERVLERWEKQCLLQELTRWIVGRVRMLAKGDPDAVENGSLERKS